MSALLFRAASRSCSVAAHAIAVWLAAAFEALPFPFAPTLRAAATGPVRDHRDDDARTRRAPIRAGRALADRPAIPWPVRWAVVALTALFPASPAPVTRFAEIQPFSP